MSVNKVILVGNLGKDPEVRSLENGTKVATCTMATSESYRDKNTNERKDITDWHDIVLWRGLAEIAEKYLRKGSLVFVEGKLKSRRYQTKEGEMRYTTEVVVDELKMLGARPIEGAASPSSITQEPVSQQSSAPSEGDDLPF